MTIWQIGTGTDGRGHHQLFFEHDLMLIGPGRHGAWPWTTQTRDEERTDAAFVRCFAEQIADGDLVIMRENSRKVLAIGRVVGDYAWLEQFADVDGWDLQHARRVKWLAESHDFGRNVFGRPRRLSSVGIPEVIKWAECAATRVDVGALAGLPPHHPVLGRDAYPPELRAAVGTLDTLARPGLGPRPAENEMVVHVVVPLLRSLGWPTELIGVEWERVDVALFRQLPRKPENLYMAIEAKRVDRGTYWPWHQATSNLARLGATADILVTDGWRYRLFAAGEERELGYGNLEKLTQPGLDMFQRLRFAAMSPPATHLASASEHQACAASR